MSGSGRGGDRAAKRNGSSQKSKDTDMTNTNAVAGPSRVVPATASAFPRLRAGSYHSSQDYEDEIEILDGRPKHLEPKREMVNLISSDEDGDEDVDTPARGKGRKRPRRRAAAREAPLARSTAAANAPNANRTAAAAVRPRRAAAAAVSAVSGRVTRTSVGGRVPYDVDLTTEDENDPDDELLYDSAEEFLAGRDAPLKRRHPRKIPRDPWDSESESEDDAEGGHIAIVNNPVPSAPILGRAAPKREIRALPGRAPNPGKKRRHDGSTPPPAAAHARVINLPAIVAAAVPGGTLATQEAVPAPATATVPAPAQADAVTNAPPVEPPQDRGALHLARILEIIPDAEIEWIVAQVKTFLPDPALNAAAGPTFGPNGNLNGAAGGADGAYVFAGTERSTDPVERVLALALENGYPKAKVRAGGSGLGPGQGNKRMRKRQVEGADEMYRSEVYRKDKRKGVQYVMRGREWLEGFFDLVPLPFIRQTHAARQHMLVPTYYVLVAETSKPIKERTYSALKAGRKGKGRVVRMDEDVHVAMLLGRDKDKMHSDASDDDNDDDDHDNNNNDRNGNGGNAANGKGKARADDNGDDKKNRNDQGVSEFVKERQWLLDAMENDIQTAAEKAQKDTARELALAEGHGVECGCCFAEEILDDLVQCQEGHLFCKDCLRGYAEIKLGEQKHAITCMDQSRCTAPFPDKSLQLVLSAKSIALYERLKQASELEAAGLEGLETCPECPFAAVIENPDERLFRCLNEECGKVSCRGCWKVEHLPKTCAEVEAEKHLDKRHAIEDAMTEALIRTCPKAGCKNRFIKEDGCNKMTCPKCHTIMCYICKRVAPEGYGHFDQAPRDPNNPVPRTKCDLWDSNAVHKQVVEARDAARAAQEAALAAEGQVVPDAMLNVAEPDRPPPNPHAQAHQAHVARARALANALPQFQPGHIGAIPPPAPAVPAHVGPPRRHRGGRARTAADPAAANPAPVIAPAAADVVQHAPNPVHGDFAFHANPVLPAAGAAFQFGDLAARMQAGFRDMHRLNMAAFGAPAGQPHAIGAAGGGAGPFPYGPGGQGAAFMGAGPPPYGAQP